MRRTFFIAALILAAAAAAAGCAPRTPARPAVEAGLVEGYRAELVQAHLNNPSGVSFSPRGELTVCDSGNGAVFVWAHGHREPIPLVTGFRTEYWKVDEKTGRKRFKLGPLSAVWLDDSVLAVTDGGLPDGKETVNFYTVRKPVPPSARVSFPPLEPRTAGECEKTNPVGPTTKEKADKGEGNLTGMSHWPGAGLIYVCGQGSDARTWVLKCDVEKRELEPAFSADDHNIKINSPMQALYKHPGWLLVLYSGEGGKEDGLIVEWDLASRKPVAQWTLPGLADPMGMAFIPGTGGELAVVDNNWALTEVKSGRLARVRLVRGKPAAEVEIIGRGLKGPVSCAFGPDGKLYVAQLGEAFDSGRGTVIAVEGFGR